MVQTSLTAWLKAVQPGNKEIQHDEDVSVPLSNNDGSARPRELSSLIIEEQSTTQLREAETQTQKPEQYKSLATKVSSLPPNARLAPIKNETLPAFRRMTTLLLPVPYPDKFYKEILSDEVVASISMIALWTDRSPKQFDQSRVVSGIRCRLLSTSQLLPLAEHGQSPTLYISTITTLAPFRGHGLASALLKRVTARAIRDYGITSVTAHMWEANEDAREWYSKHGFKEVFFDANYYRKLRPSGASTLQRMIGPRDLLVEMEVDD